MTFCYNNFRNYEIFLFIVATFLKKCFPTFLFKHYFFQTLVSLQMSAGDEDECNYQYKTTPAEKIKFCFKEEFRNVKSEDIASCSNCKKEIGILKTQIERYRSEIDRNRSEIEDLKMVGSI